MNRISRHELKVNKVQQQASAVSGDGLYLYRNAGNYDLTLPRPTKTGIRSVGAKKTFEGDNYYMQYVKTGMLRLVEEISPPAQPKENIVEEKLLLDQPEMVTESGAIEHVVQKTPVQKLTEAGDNAQPKPVLINEAPCGDSFVIIQ